MHSNTIILNDMLNGGSIQVVEALSDEGGSWGL